jgi:feruloyl esterase
MLTRGLALGGLAALAGTVAGSALQCTECAISRALAGSGATVNYVRHVPLNGSFIGSVNDTLGPSTYTGLPALCAVSINVPSSATTSFNFGLFMPDGWNGRIITTGNGGFGGGINWVSLLTGFQPFPINAGN